MKCECGSERIQTDHMMRVGGKEGFMPEGIDVHTCLDCGRKWHDESES